MKKQIDKKLKVTCEKLLFGGIGLARTENGIVFVEDLLPSEEADVAYVSKKGGIPLYRVVNRLTTSSARRKPSCKYYGKCGGCNWLHINYSNQLEFKKEILIDALSRIGKLENIPGIELFSGEELGYRTRVQFKVDSRSSSLGFFKKQSRLVIDIDKCPLLSDNLNKLLENRKLILKNSGIKRDIKVIDTFGGLVSNPEIRDYTSYFGNIKVGNNSFKINGNSFFQSNLQLTEKLASWCSNELSGDNLLDLFGGVGLFTIFHQHNFRSTVLVERDELMVKEANDMFKSSNLVNCKAICKSAESFFSESEVGNYDTIIADPPRTGLDRAVIDGIIKISPKKLLYISCNPTTQARDIKLITENSSYKIDKVALFDLYPNTYHLESGILLSKHDKEWD